MNVMRDTSKSKGKVSAKRGRPSADGSQGISIKPKKQGNAHQATEASSWVVSDLARGALQKCELFQDISTQQLMKVAALVEEMSVVPDKPLLSEGDDARHLLVIVEGCGVAQLKLDHGWLSLGLVGPSEAAGWSALLGGNAYPASVKSLTPMKFARIETKGLLLLMEIEPEIGYPILRRLSSVFWRQYRSALKTYQTFV